ncbi:MAG: hypothetical protein ACJ79R_00390, partial [Anaeromyxobacteraceae bacterium]
MLAAALALALAAAPAPASPVPSAGAAPESTPTPGAAPAPHGGQGSYEAALRAAREAFSRRGDPAQLAHAITAFERARALGEGHPAAEVGLARAHAFQARADP